MNDFRTLLQLLKKELACQEKLLLLLGKERVAIVGVKQTEIESLGAEKEKVILAAQNIERERTAALYELRGEAPRKQPLKISELIAKCDAKDVKRELESAVSDLRKTATAVREMNDHNSILLNQSLGLIASTLAIIRSAPDTDLPTYGSSGRLTAQEDPAFARRSGRVTQEV